MLWKSIYSVEENEEGIIYTSSKACHEPHHIIPTQLDLSVPSSVNNVLRTLRSASSSNVLTTEARNDAGVGASKSSR
jgi:hypothetical protein